MENATNPSGAQNVKTCPHCKLEVDYRASRCPHCQGKIYVWTRSRKLIAGAIGLAVIFSVIVGSSNPDTEPTSTVQPAAVQQVAQVFDVPSLVGKNLEQLRTLLGTPSYDEAPTATYVRSSDIRTWDKTWTKNGYSLTATYNIDTGNVVDIFLGADNDTALGVFRSTDNILKVGNLSTDSAQYSVEFVRIKAVLGQSTAQAPEGYTGAIVRPR